MRSLMVGVTFVMPLAWVVLQEKWDPAWVDYACRGGMFTVTCPDVPREDRAELKDSGLGGRVDLICFHTEDDRLRYLVGYGDFPAHGRWSDAEAALEVLTSMLLFEKPATPLVMNPLAMGSYPGREVSYPCGSGAWIRQQTWLYCQRFYVVQVLGSAEAVRSAQADRFLSSFRARLP